MTAVEWLYKNLLDNPMSNEDVIYNINVLEQANEMFKQQIIDAWEDGQNSFPTINAEKYYKEQFKNK
jgi:hypothetical protein